MGAHGIIKKEGWEKRMYDTIADWKDTPFQWGGLDCFHFVLDCLEKMADDILMDMSKIKYTSAKGSLSQMKKHFGTMDIVAFVQNEFGFKTVWPEQAQRGDIAFIDQTIGIVDTEIIWAMGENGLVSNPISNGTAFLKVE